MKAKIKKTFPDGSTEISFVEVEVGLVAEQGINDESKGEKTKRTSRKTPSKA